MKGGKKQFLSELIREFLLNQRPVFVRNILNGAFSDQDVSVGQVWLVSSGERKIVKLFCFRNAL